LNNPLEKSARFALRVSDPPSRVMQLCVDGRICRRRDDPSPGAHLGSVSTSSKCIRYQGVVLRHARGCRLRQGGRCSCTPTYQAQVWSARERKTIRKTFPTLAAARAWRQESQVALRQGTLRSPSQTTLNQAAQEWLAAAEAGLVRTRSGDTYKPSALRAYRQALHHRVLPTLGSRRLTALSRTMLQDLATSSAHKALSASSIRNTILPRAIYRRALNRGEVAPPGSRCHLRTSPSGKSAAQRRRLAAAA
jgi:hypothetical protein